MYLFFFFPSGFMELGSFWAHKADLFGYVIVRFSLPDI